LDATARPWPGTLSSRQARWSRYQRRGDTSGEASDGEKSDGEAGDALPSSATDVESECVRGWRICLTVSMQY